MMNIIIHTLIKEENSQPKQQNWVINRIYAPQPEDLKRKHNIKILEVLKLP